MAFNGAGVFSALYSWVSDAANGLPISSSRMTAQDNDIASGLSNCVTRDGQGKPSAAIDWNAQNLTNVATFSATAGTITTLAATNITGIPLFAAYAPLALTDGATITPDQSLAVNWTLTIGGNRTLANMTNSQPGTGGVIVITQDGTGSRTLAYGTHWKFPNGAPSLSTAANAIDVISYFVVSSTVILCGLTKAYS